VSFAKIESALPAEQISDTHRPNLGIETKPRFNLQWESAKTGRLKGFQTEFAPDIHRMATKWTVANRPGRSDDATRRAWRKTQPVSALLVLRSVAGWACLFRVPDEFGRGGNSECILTAGVSGDAR
jgi:hypothetical protein